MSLIDFIEFYRFKPSLGEASPHLDEFRRFQRSVGGVEEEAGSTYLDYGWKWLSVNLYCHLR
jgi:hypothetical protein